MGANQDLLDLANTVRHWLRIHDLHLEAIRNRHHAAADLLAVEKQDRLRDLRLMVGFRGAPDPERASAFETVLLGPSMAVCLACGCAVVDREKHSIWHEQEPR
jgi:hypothetical protein